MWGQRKESKPADNKFAQGLSEGICVRSSESSDSLRALSPFSGTCGPTSPSNAKVVPPTVKHQGLASGRLINPRMVTGPSPLLPWEEGADRCLTDEPLLLCGPPGMIPPELKTLREKGEQTHARQQRARRAAVDRPTEVHALRGDAWGGGPGRRDPATPEALPGATAGDRTRGRGGRHTGARGARRPPGPSRRPSATRRSNSSGENSS